MHNKKRIVVISGAGISAESGIKTFRDTNGLWEGHDIMEVASPEGWCKNPGLVLDFYNLRRKQLFAVKPNLSHIILAEMQKDFEVKIITQNVDDLHERAGSKNVLHLHGELLKVRSEKNNAYILEWKKDLNPGDSDPNGNQLRPHIVWFGEEVPAISEAVSEVEKAEVLIIVGTSLQVYPAAGLMHYAPKNCTIFYIDKNPNTDYTISNKIKVIKQTASTGLQELRSVLYGNI